MKHTLVCRERDQKERHKKEIPAIWSQGWTVKLPSPAGLLLVGVQSGLLLYDTKHRAGSALHNLAVLQCRPVFKGFGTWAATSSTILFKLYLFICPFAAVLQSPGVAQKSPACHPAVWLVMHSVLKWKCLWSGKVGNSDLSSLNIWL